MTDRQIGTEDCTSHSITPLALLFVLGCTGAAASSGGSSSSSGGSGGSGPPDPSGPKIVVAFPPVKIGAGDELVDWCMSYTLDNEAPINVNRVTMNAGPAWHHSNWFFVADSMYDGPDGAWECSTRKYEEFKFGPDGGILFAQSTQSSHEVQAFPAGAGVVMPKHARIVGGIHLVNVGEAEVSTSITLELGTLPDAELTTKLNAMTFAYFPLDLPPNAASKFTADCPVQGGPFDFSIYYLLPHYHGFGRGLELSTSGGPLGEQSVFKGSSTIGEPLGKMFDPPKDVRGATDLRVSCSYDNTGSTEIKWGNAGGEMCVMLAFTDSPHRWAGSVDADNQVVGMENGTVLNEGPCTFGVH